MTGAGESLSEMSPLEQQVVDAARRGVWAEPRTSVGVAELASTEDAGLCVRAELIRELLIGRHGELDPHGLRVRGVRILGQLDLEHVTAVVGFALTRCALPQGFTCCSARLQWVDLRGSSLSGLTADGLRTDDRLSLEGATLRGAGELGAVRLIGAHIGGQCDFERATIVNDTGPALCADRMRTGGSLLAEGVILRGAGKSSAAQLIGVQISGQCDFEGATVVNSAGPALCVDRMRTDGSLLLAGATVLGAGELGAVRLLGAQIGGQVNLAGVQVVNESGPLLVLSEARVDGILTMPAPVVCPEGSVAVRSGDCAAGQRQVFVHGLEFARLDRVSWREWLHLLVHHTPKYAPQPYQQLAGVERISGHDNNARQILITQQDDLRRRAPEALGGTLARWRHRLWGVVGRYGYRAHRLVTALVLTLTVAGALGYLAGQVTTRPGHLAAERVLPATAPSTGPGTACSTAELIGLGIDRGLPLGATGLRARCDLATDTRWGQAFTYAIWALQAIVWALATLAVAAYTGLVRKPA
ncbi:hypothetical protein Acsp05_13090 [Actinokineospora sp. NBRC 105648]|nr:hypothetical protein Acsp05_13090 [Actinokineospora sp. NBRC 105648]